MMSFANYEDGRRRRYDDKGVGPARVSLSVLTSTFTKSATGLGIDLRKAEIQI